MRLRLSGKQVLCVQPRILDVALLEIRSRRLQHLEDGHAFVNYAGLQAVRASTAEKPSFLELLILANAQKRQRLATP